MWARVAVPWVTKHQAQIQVPDLLLNLLRLVVAQFDVRAGLQLLRALARNLDEVRHHAANLRLLELALLLVHRADLVEYRVVRPDPGELHGVIALGHPEAARGQIIGGVVQGIGYALMEEIPMDPDTGAPLTLNLDSFKIPNLIDIPPIDAVLLEQPDPIGPYGAKALGEPPLVPVAAAVANAVYDATAVRIRDLPITAEKVLHGLQQKRN